TKPWRTAAGTRVNSSEAWAQLSGSELEAGHPSLQSHPRASAQNPSRLARDLLPQSMQRVLDFRLHAVGSARRLGRAGPEAADQVVEGAAGQLLVERRDLRSDHLLMALLDVVISDPLRARHALHRLAVRVEQGLVPAGNEGKQLGDHDPGAESE